MDHADSISAPRRRRLAWSSPWSCLEGKTLAQFNEGPHTVAEHDSIEEAATWLDGYLKGVMRQKSLDRTVC